MMKQMAAKPKKAKGSKGGAKPKPGSAKPVVNWSDFKKEQAVEEVKKAEEQVTLDKETRKKMDTEQLLTFCDKLCETKANQVAIVWEILRCVNQGKEAQILNY